MKRVFVGLIATAVLAVFVGSALAGEPDLKSAQGVKKFWNEKTTESGGGL